MNNNDIAKIKDIIIKHFVENKIHACCLVGSIILFEQLIKKGLNAKLQLGFLLSDAPDDERFANRHVWVEVDDNKIDIGTDISHTLFEKIREASKYVKHSLSLTCDDYDRIDLDNKEDILQEKYLVKSFELYIKDPELYWNGDLYKLMRDDYNKKYIKNIVDGRARNKQLKKIIDKEINNYDTTNDTIDVDFKHCKAKLKEYIIWRNKNKDKVIPLNNEQIECFQKIRKYWINYKNIDPNYLWKLKDYHMKIPHKRESDADQIWHKYIKSCMNLRIRLQMKMLSKSDNDVKKVPVLMDDDKKELLRILVLELDTIQPYPPNLDDNKGFPKMSSKQQIKRYITGLKIAYRYSKRENIRYVANSYFNAIMKNAHKFFSTKMYRQFVKKMKKENIVPNKY